LSDGNNNIERRSSTANLKHDHLTVRRVGAIAQRCSDKLYAGDEDIPIEDIEILSVVIEEFIDAFHHGKEEKATVIRVVRYKILEAVVVHQNQSF
jgi:hemerythrin-like domain-containing protein